MRKLFFLLPLCIMICSISCSSDEDTQNIPEEENYIIGKWEVERISINGEIQDLNACSTKSTVEFLSNGTLHFTFYSGSGDCVIETSEEKWEYIGNDIFKFIDLDDGEAYETTIKFSNNHDKITITEENSDGLIVIDYRRI